MKRRAFLGALARLPAVAAIGGKMMADKAAAELSGMSINGLGGDINMPSAGPPSEPSADQWRHLLRFKSVRDELETLLAETDYRRVYGLDHDLAVKRSFSLAAKVTFQRQRLVAERLAQMQSRWPWQRMTDIAERVMGVKL